MVSLEQIPFCYRLSRAIGMLGKYGGLKPIEKQNAKCAVCLDNIPQFCGNPIIHVCAKCLQFRTPGVTNSLPPIPIADLQYQYGEVVTDALLATID